MSILCTPKYIHCARSTLVDLGQPWSRVSCISCISCVMPGAVLLRLLIERGRNTACHMNCTSWCVFPHEKWKSWGFPLKNLTLVVKRIQRWRLLQTYASTILMLEMWRFNKIHCRKTREIAGNSNERPTVFNICSLQICVPRCIAQRHFACFPIPKWRPWEDRVDGIYPGWYQPMVFSTKLLYIYI